jgi:hypothetical protein
MSALTYPNESRQDKPLVWLRGEIHTPPFSRVAWRIICRIDHDAILILEVFRKLTPHTPAEIISTCKQRLWSYDHA